MTGSSAAVADGNVTQGWRRRLSAYGESPRFGVVIAAIAAVYVLLIYSNVVELLPHAGAVGIAAARLVIYSAFAIGIAATIVTTARARPRSIGALLLAAYATAFALIVLLHITVIGDGIGPATKSFIAGIFYMIGFGFLLGLRAARTPVGVCTILIVVATAALCVIDLVVVGGRPAGLYFNPNVAALALLLGALGTVRSLPPSLRFPIILIVALGLLATLSRSGLLIASVIALTVLLLDCPDILKHRAAYRIGAWSVATVLIAGSAYLAMAHLSSAPISNELLWERLRIIVFPTADAKKIVSDRSMDAVSSRSLASTDIATPIDCTSWTAVLHGLHKAQSCPWLDPQVMDREEHINSVVARIRFTLRGIATIVDAPWLGSGLDRAFSLRPHNSFLLFGIAYGVGGLLFVPVFCIFICRHMGMRNGLPLVIFVALTSVFSHDIFLSRDLVAGLAIALSSNERAWQI
jgi:hypothetical protein